MPARQVEKIKAGRCPVFFQQGGLIGVADAAKCAQQRSRRRGHFVLHMAKVPYFYHLPVHFFQQGGQAQPPGQKKGHIHTGKTGGKGCIFVR